MPLIDSACATCGLPLSDKATSCGDCLKQPKPYTVTVCPLLYTHPVDHLINEFKKRRPQTVVQQLALLMKPTIERCYQYDSWPDALIPVPLHWYSKLKRGFNQAHCLADIIAGFTEIPCTPVAYRNKRSKVQKRLGRKDRLRNLQQTFECDKSLNGQHVVIIDDVVTSCATVINMANTLLNAGAERVDVWALARTPKPGS